MSKLVLVRHGESQWNQKQVFTGWADVSLTSRGVEEVQELAQELQNIQFDIMFTSRLERARMTLLMIASKQERTAVFIHKKKEYDAIFDDRENVPVFSDRSLNERHYGLLQGMKKHHARDKFGQAQVHQWRRSYDVRPTKGESLHDVYERVVPYFQDKIIPELRNEKNILISAHGNSLRALIKYIDNISDEDVVNLELAPGDVITYSMKNNILTKNDGAHEFTRPLQWQ